MKLRLVSDGRWSLHAACDENGNCPLLMFLSELHDRNDKDAEAMLRLFRTITRDGPAALGEAMSRPIKGIDGLFEFKRGTLRVFWFYDRNRIIVCSHGMKKKTRKTPKLDLARARRTRDRYLEAKRQNNLMVER